MAHRFEVIRRECRKDKWYYNHAGIPESVVQAAEALVALMGDDGPKFIEPFDGGIEMKWGKFLVPWGCTFEVIVSEEEGKIEFLVFDYEGLPEEALAPQFETAQEVYEAYGVALRSARNK